MQSTLRAILRIPRNLVRRFELDARSLAAFRIIVGLVLLGDLIERLFNFTIFHTIDGMFPWGALWSREGMTVISIHPLLDEPWWQALLFAVTIGFTLCFVLGYRTRLATVVLFFLYSSLTNLVPAILHHSDILLRILLFWSMFLPLNRHYSLDLRLGRATPPPSRDLLTIGTIGLVAQVVLLYNAASVSKWNEAWTYEGNALHFVLQWDLYVTPLGKLLQSMEWLTPLLTVSTWWLQFLAPFLILLPIRSHLLRGVVALMLIGLHASMIPFLDLGAFPYVTMAMLVALLPGRPWEWLFERAPARLRGWLSPHESRPPRVPDLPRPVRRVLGWIWATVGVVILAMVVWTNVHKTYEWPKKYPNPSRAWLTHMGIQQTWTMFSKGGYNKTGLIPRGWFTFAATHRSGKQVDLFRHGEPLTWDPPEHVSAYYTSDRWRTWWERAKSRYLGGVVDKAYVTESMQRWAQYQCATSDPDDPLEEVTIYSTREHGYGTKDYRRRKLLHWSCTCGVVHYQDRSGPQSAKLVRSIPDLRKVCIDERGYLETGDCLSLNDRLTRVEVPEGRQVRLFGGVRYRGRVKTLEKGSHALRKYGLHRRASSLTCNPDQ